MTDFHVTLGYIGPGAGLGLFWALVTVVVATFSALSFVLLWPLRSLVRRLRDAPGPAESSVGVAESAAHTALPPAGNERHDQPTAGLS